MSGFVPPHPQSSQKKNKDDGDHKTKVNYTNLPCPVDFEEINLEAARTLNTGCFEGLKVDIVNPLSPKFAYLHSCTLSSQEIPTRSSEVVKTPVSAYGFGALYNEPKLNLVGRIDLPGGNVTGIVVKEFSDNLACRADILCAHEPHMSGAKATINYKGTDYKTMLRLGTGSSVEASYIQRISPGLSVGGAISWIGQERKSGTVFSGRYDWDKWISTVHVVHGQLLALDVVRKITDRVSLAADFRYDLLSKQSIASAGYDFLFRESRVRGKLDSNGCAGVLVEQAIMGGALKLLLSGEIDHGRGDHKFGIGINR